MFKMVSSPPRKGSLASSCLAPCAADHTFYFRITIFHLSTWPPSFRVAHQPVTSIVRRTFHNGPAMRLKMGYTWLGKSSPPTNLNVCLQNPHLSLSCGMLCKDPLNLPLIVKHCLNVWLQVSDMQTVGQRASASLDTVIPVTCHVSPPSCSPYTCHVLTAAVTQSAIFNFSCQRESNPIFQFDDIRT